MGRIEIHDYQTSNLLRKLKRFLGEENVRRKIQAVERNLRVAKPIYRDYWLRPHVEWWLGLKDAEEIESSGRSFRGRLTPRIKSVLEIATKISAMYRSMPETTRNEYRQRILANDNLRPVFFELDIAAHYAQRDARLTWNATSHEPKQRSVEFVAKINNTEVEVECKTKGVDAGRRITRPAFYRLFDELLPQLANSGLMGKISITVSDRMPTDAKWMQSVVDQLTAQATPSTAEIPLNGGARAQLTLRARTGQPVDLATLQSRAFAEKPPFGHACVFAHDADGTAIDPITVVVHSAQPDRLLDDIFQDLRDKHHQLSGTRAGIICCFIPEIDSFEELGGDSAIRNMTNAFFERHAPSFLHSVVYCSDAQWEARDNVTDTYLPTLRFENPHCTVSLPPAFLPTPRRS